MDLDKAKVERMNRLLIARGVDSLRDVCHDERVQQTMEGWHLMGPDFGSLSYTHMLIVDCRQN